MRLEDDPDYQAAMANQRAENMGYNHSKENSKHLTGKWLAELLDVSPAAVSMAASKEHRCQGYPVYKWKDSDGRYWVPLSVYRDLTADIEVENGRSSGCENYTAERSNPEPSSNGVSKSTENETEQKAEETAADNSEELLEDGFISNSGNISLLPEGQNYVEPVAAAALGSVGTSVVENDTPNGRAVMYSATVGVGSYMGYKFADDHWIGALIGALFGFGTAYLGNMSYNHTHVSKDEKKDLKDEEQDLSDISPKLIDQDPEPKSKGWDHAIDWQEVVENLHSIGNGNSSESKQLESIDLPASKAS